MINLQTVSTLQDEADAAEDAAQKARVTTAVEEGRRITNTPALAVAAQAVAEGGIVDDDPSRPNTGALGWDVERGI